MLKTISQLDLEELKPRIEELEYLTTDLTKNGVRIDIGHPMRFWEYGLALKYLEIAIEVYKKKKLTVLEVGSGIGLLGPAIAIKYGLLVTESEPNMDCYPHRVACNAYLKSKRRPEIRWYPNRLEDLPVGTYDAVFCTSVVEHIPREDESAFWSLLANRVNSGGLLFMTTDVMENPGAPHVFDNLRHTNYNMDMLKRRIENLMKIDGFEYVGKEEPAFHGNFVHDYSFAAWALQKTK